MSNVYKYSANTKYSAYRGDPKADKIIKKIAREIKDDVRNLITKLIEKKRDEIVKTALKLEPCEFCITKHFVEQVILEICKIARNGTSRDKVAKKLDPDIANP